MTGGYGRGDAIRAETQTQQESEVSTGLNIVAYLLIKDRSNSTGGGKTD